MTDIFLAYKFKIMAILSKVFVTALYSQHPQNKSLTSDWTRQRGGGNFRRGLEGGGEWVFDKQTKSSYGTCIFIPKIHLFLNLFKKKVGEGTYKCIQQLPPLPNPLDLCSFTPGYIHGCILIILIGIEMISVAYF